MKRSFSRIPAEMVCALACLVGGIAAAQAPEQHWQATPNYPSNNPPNYQPAGGGGQPVGNPVAGQNNYVQQPGGTASYPPAQPAGPPAMGQPGYGPVANPGVNPTDPRMQPGGPGPVAGQPIQGPPQRPAPPQAPFTLTPPEIAALENLLVDWEKRNKEIHVLESKFFRWKYDAVFGNVNQPPPPDEGELKFAAPDKGLIIIRAKDPKQSEQWLCDGKSVFQWDYSKNVVTEFVMPPELQGKGIGDGPLPFVFGVEAEKLKQRYFMRIITPANVQNEVWLEAYPKYQNDAANFKKVEVILQISAANRALLPYAIQIYAPNGKDRVVYQLQNPSINPRRILDLWGDWTKPSVPFGWTRKVELPPQPVQAGRTPSLPPRR